jgi:hypothetical protein
MVGLTCCYVAVQKSAFALVDHVGQCGMLVARVDLRPPMPPDTSGTRLLSS